MGNFYPEGKEFVIGTLRFDISSAKSLEITLSSWLENIEKEELAKSISLEVGFVSVSYLQRKMAIGYTRAARIVDRLIEDGFCEPKRNEAFRFAIIKKDVAL